MYRTFTASVIAIAMQGRGAEAAKLSDTPASEPAVLSYAETAFDISKGGADP